MGSVRWIVLGTAHAIPDREHPNTHFLCVDGDRLILVDCPGGTGLHLTTLGFSPIQITDVVVTHFHPDHVSGVPLLLMDLWLMGRKAPLHLHGLTDTLNRIEAMMRLFEWENWPDFYPVVFHRLPSEEYTLVLETAHTRWLASPVKHLVPAIGLRIEMPQWGKTLAYSGDTEVCPAMERLAQGADVLFHEATGSVPGHTAPQQVGLLAARAGVKQVYLVHLSPAHHDQAVAAVRQVYSGPVTVPGNFTEVVFP